MYLDQFYRIHLEWMFENQPQLVRDLLRQNKLKDLLDRKEQSGLKRAQALMNQGQSWPEAVEIVSSEILAPPDGPAMSETPPEPMSEQETKVVYQRLSALGDAEERKERLKSQPNPLRLVS